MFLALMQCVFLMQIRPRTKVSASERLNFEHPVCFPHSKPMTAAWYRGMKLLCFSIRIAYLLLNSEAGRFQGLWALHTQSPIISLALPKGWLIYSQPRNNRMKLTIFLSFDFWPCSLFAKAPVPLVVSSWGSKVLDTVGMLPVDKGWPLSFVMGDFILRLSPSCEGWRPRCLRSPWGSAGCWLRHSLLGCGPGNLTGLPGPQGCNLWLWPH